jgi:hypothetical protein
MAKIVSAPTHGTKATLSTNVFLYAWKGIPTLPEIERYAEWHRCCPCGNGSSCREWLESASVQTIPWCRAPSEELLSRYNPARLKGSSSHELYASDNGPLCVDEFARLACILTQHEDARRALLDSQLDLTRAQLDRTERREEFWTLKIAPLFNSPGTVVSFNPPIYLPQVSTHAPPLTSRSCSRLLRSWAGTRSLFTVSHTNWSASGQNDPTNFLSFLPAPVGGGDQIPVESRRVLVLFRVFGCGSARENTEVLHCVRRTSKDPYDDMEKPPNSVAVSAQAKCNGSTSGCGLKRKNNEDDDVSHAFLEGAKRLADAISVPQRSPSTSLRNEVGSGSILETSKLIEEYSRIMVLLGKAESEEADDDYIEILRTQLKLAKDRIKVSQKREEERNISGRW